MKAFVTFWGKEMTEMKRSGRLLILTALFVLFGLMNPAVAKLTPMLFDLMAESLESSGITVTEYTVTAMDSWVQFFKNMPMALLVAVILYGGLFTSEYSGGTLVPLLAKGMPRSAAAWAKTAVMLLTWSGGYWLSFGITAFYSDYYWDSSVAGHYPFAAFCLWLTGVMAFCLITFFSSFAGSAAQVLLGTGAVFGVSYLLSIAGNIREYLPTYLMESGGLLTGRTQPADYLTAVLVTAGISVAALAASFPLLSVRKM